MSGLPTITDRNDEIILEIEKYDESWRKVERRCKAKIRQAEEELKGFGCGKKRTSILRGAAMAYEDILSMGEE